MFKNDSEDEENTLVYLKIMFKNKNKDEENKLIYLQIMFKNKNEDEDEEEESTEPNPKLYEEPYSNSRYQLF